MVVTNGGLLDKDHRLISANGATPQFDITFSNNGISGTRIVKVNLNISPLSVLTIDPLVASVRITASQTNNSKSHPSQVSVDVLPDIYYVDVKTEVDLSVILSDGYRTQVTDPSEIKISSSNTTVATVEGNSVTGRRVGKTVLTIEWLVCGSVLASKDISVRVIVDQFRPEFNPTEGNITVSEDASIGDVVYIAMAVDRDVEQLQSVQYSLVNDYEGTFTIDEVTGVVTVTGPLDREVIDSYVLRIRATDQVQRDCELEEGSGLGETSSLCSSLGPISEFTVSTIEQGFPICIIISLRTFFVFCSC